MNRNPFPLIHERRSDADEIATACATWRNESAAGHAAYGSWARAAASGANCAFAAYQTALGREERAAERYARLISRAQRGPELDVA
jgi:hypothetical protein